MEKRIKDKDPLEFKLDILEFGLAHNLKIHPGKLISHPYPTNTSVFTRPRSEVGGSLFTLLYKMSSKFFFVNSLKTADTAITIAGLNKKGKL